MMLEQANKPVKTGLTFLANNPTLKPNGAIQPTINGILIALM